MKRTSGFTLPELLTVIAIIALLMMASFGALSRARELGKRAKSEAQLRELVNAWQQYYVTYGKWPSRLNGQDDVEANATTLAPLTDPDDSDNEYGVVFLNADISGKLLDAWGNAYRLSFESSSSGNDRNKIVFETSVALPRRISLMP
jgi:prepilin-type N-terminal cleavage/methylation domain-containing protein